MTYSSSLVDDARSLILDTSVLINLHASSFGECILTALPHEVLIAEIVAAELEHETSKANGGHHFIGKLVASGDVQLVRFSAHESSTFMTLISESPSLDDGEAATIAIAAHRGYLPIIDERKGRLLAQTFIEEIDPMWSLDLFRHPLVLESLGESKAEHALYLALRDGRMQIHEDHCDYVVKVIGVQRALNCQSLPGYRVRRQKWLDEVDTKSRTEIPSF